MRTAILRSGIMIFCMALFQGPFSASAGNETPGPTDDYTLHTLYIFNFAKYVEWPAASKTIKVGVVGNTAVEEHLAKMAKAKSTGAVVFSVINTKNEAELGDCQVVFIPENNTALAAKLIESFKGRPILVITEEADFTKKGASVSFKIVSGKLRFQINEEAIKSNGLKVSGSLTALAEK
jgi:hypothetical protein